MIDRRHAIATLAAEEFDLLVIGGGITGAGVALEAAVRGLAVALVERGDYASGASSRSSKLLHGWPPSGDVFHACQVDDARLVLAVLDEADRWGAVCANRVEGLELVEERGRIAAVAVRDTERDGGFTIAADRIVDATGAWAGDLTGDGPSELSRGAHIVLRARDLQIDRAGVAMPSADGDRVLALPWMGRVLVGTVAEDHDGDIDDVRPTGEDVDHLLDAVNSCFGAELERADVMGAFAGVGPLGERLHASRTGVVTVTGTTLARWRETAERTVDRVLEQDGRAAPCRRHHVELPPKTDRETEIRRIAAADPNTALPIVDGRPELLAEAVYAARREQARTVADVLLRRTRLGVLAARDVCEPAGDVALRVADAMAPELGWTPGRAAREAAAWAVEARTQGLVVSPKTEVRTP